ncbi:MAG: SurA N-terminal domain-containing protein [Myxococcales bacterium]|nr:SurA N-terminal domain-containing protein [Myxococcales bacterium]
MFDNLRKSGSSMIIWILFGILIAGFVISFGPQSVGSSQGCQSSGRMTVLKIGGRTLDDASWRFAFGLARGGEGERARELAALDQLVRRELLASEAERRGLRVADGLIDHVITAGEVHYGGRVIPAKGAFYDEEGKGVFNYQQFKRFVFQRMNMSVAGYKRQQTREILATTMERLLRGSVAVSIEEARARYIAENTTVAFDAVRFEPTVYADALRITDADLDRYLAAHEAEVKATYVEASWKGKKQVRVRRVFVAATPPPPTGAAPTIDPARAKLDAARAEIAAGKKTFAQVASALDADEGFRNKGGDWGWYDEAAMTLPEPALNDAVKALTEPNAVSPVVVAGAGFYLLQVSDRRAGDLTFDQVKRDLAEKLARPAWGQEAARRAALLALETAKTAGKSLKDLYPAEQTGAITSTSVDVPTAWMQAGGSGGSAAPAAGSAAAAPAAGSAAPAAGAPAVPAAPPAPVAPTAIEQLPAVGVVALKVDSFPALARFGNRTMVGESAELTKAVFEDLTDGALGERVYEVKTGAIGAAPVYVIVQVSHKQLADEKEFQKDGAKYVGELTAQRGEEYLRDWLKLRCKALVAKNEVQPRRELLTVDTGEGKLALVPWDPCARL